MASTKIIGYFNFSIYEEMRSIYFSMSNFLKRVRFKWVIKKVPMNFSVAVKVGNMCLFLIACMDLIPLGLEVFDEFPFVRVG